MAKKNNKKKNSIDIAKIIEKIKPFFDIKEWKRKLRYKNENTQRLTNIYTLIIGMVIIIITINTVLSQGNTTYPLNLTATESIKSEINSAENVRRNLNEHIDNARKYASIVEEEQESIKEIERYLPAVVDPLSLMVHIERIAERNGITVGRIILPENRSLLETPTDDLNLEDEGVVESNNDNVEEVVNESVEDTTSSNAGSLIGDEFEEEVIIDEDEDLEEDSIKTRKPIVDDMSYMVDVTIIGQYSNLAGFFKDLENTREIIEISDVKISEHELENEREENQYIDITNFDMEMILTQIDFKVKLYDKRAFVEFMHLDDIEVEQNLSEDEENE